MTTAPIAGNQYFTVVSDLARQVPELNVARLTADTVSANVTDSTLLSSGGAVANTMVVGTVDLSKSTAPADHLALLDSAGVAISLPAGSQVHQASYKTFNNAGADGAVTPPGTAFDFGLGEATALGVPGSLIAANSLVVAGTGTIANLNTGGVVSGVAAGVAILGASGQQLAGYGLLVPASPLNALVLTGVGAAVTGVLEVTLHYAAVRS